MEINSAPLLAVSPESLRGLYFAVYIMGAVVGILLLIWFATWIYTSLFRNTNSANVTGEQFVRKYLNQYGFTGKKVAKTKSFEIKSQFLMLTPWHYNKKQPDHLIVKLAPWTYSRSSLYTLAKAGEVAYCTSKGIRLFVSWFWSLIVNIGILITVFFIANIILLITTEKALFGADNPSKTIITLGILSAIIFIISASIPVYFYIVAMKPVYEFSKQFLTSEEAKLIKWIYIVRILYLIAQIIYELLKLILYILAAYSD